MSNNFLRSSTTELYNIWRKHAPPSLKPKTWRGLVPADANWSRLLVVTTDQKGNAKLQTKVFAPLVVSKNSLRVNKKRKIIFKVQNLKYETFLHYLLNMAEKVISLHSTMQESTVNHGKFVQVGIYTALN